MNKKNQIFYVKCLLLVLLLVSFFIKPAKAAIEDFGIDISLASYHTQRCFRDCTEEFNEVNLGAFLIYSANDNVEFSLGYFDNSFNRNSTAALIDVHTSSLINFPIRINLGITAGVASGYGGTGFHQRIGFGDDFLPLAMPNIKFQKNKWRFIVGVLPTGREFDDAIFTFRTGFSF